MCLLSLSLKGTGCKVKCFVEIHLIGILQFPVVLTFFVLFPFHCRSLCFVFPFFFLLFLHGLPNEEITYTVLVVHPKPLGGKAALASRISGEQLISIMVDSWLKNDSFSEKKFDAWLN